MESKNKRRQIKTIQDLTDAIKTDDKYRIFSELESLLEDIEYYKKEGVIPLTGAITFVSDINGVKMIVKDQEDSQDLMEFEFKKKTKLNTHNMVLKKSKKNLKALKAIKRLLKELSEKLIEEGTSGHSATGEIYLNTIHKDVYLHEENGDVYNLRWNFSKRLVLKFIPADLHCSYMKCELRLMNEEISKGMILNVLILEKSRCNEEGVTYGQFLDDLIDVFQRSIDSLRKKTNKKPLN